jgi:hypothetical protein
MYACKQQMNGSEHSRSLQSLTSSAGAGENDDTLHLTQSAQHAIVVCLLLMRSTLQQK